MVQKRLIQCMRLFRQRLMLLLVKEDIERINGLVGHGLVKIILNDLGKAG
ncbi:MAG: hypothetical protein ACK4V4_00480 [Sphingobacteriales bacterium]